MVIKAFSVIKKTAVKKTVLQKAIMLSIGGLLFACSLQAHESSHKKEPALLPADSKAARTEIIALVSQSLGRKNIAIADNVFQQSSRLLLGKTAITSPAGIRVYPDNITTALIIFELVKQESNCLLRRTDTEQTWQLMTKRCFTP